VDLKKYLILGLVGRKKVTDKFEHDQTDSIKLDFSELKKGWTGQTMTWRKPRYGGKDGFIAVAEASVKAIQIDSANPSR
jgi:hypothetical protein